MVEHFHGKEGVAGSSPAPGSLRRRAAITAITAATLALPLSLWAGAAGAAVRLDAKNRFSVHVDDPNTGVEVILNGKLRRGAVTGTARFTFLDLHPGSPSNDTLCDSGVRTYRAD